MLFCRYASIAILLLVYSSAALGCSMAGCTNDGDEMRPTFTIVGRHDDKPLAGVSFHVVAKGSDQFSGLTDEKGIIQVPKLSPGLYWLNGDLLGTGVVYTCFHVGEKPSRRAKARLNYTWGDEAPGTSKIAGRLVESQPGKGGTPIWNLVHRTEVPIAGASLRLQDPITHAVYLASSDQDGRFSFEGMASGTYVLHIEAGAAGDRSYDATDQLVRLDDTATRSFLVFKRRDGGGGSCGGTDLDLQNE